MWKSDPTRNAFAWPKQVEYVNQFIKKDYLATDFDEMLRSRRMMCNAKPKSSIDNSTSGVIVLSDSDDSSAGAKPAAQNPVVMRFNRSVAEAKARRQWQRKKDQEVQWLPLWSCKTVQILPQMWNLGNKSWPTALNHNTSDSHSAVFRMNVW